LGEHAHCLAPPVPYHGLPDLISFSELASGVTFAIAGGTGDFKKAHGTVTVITPKFTYRVK
jgi:hypothetical protein